MTGSVLQWLTGSALPWVLALVAAQRLAELWLAGRNTRRLLAAGGREVGGGHYPLFVLLHAGWLAAILATTPLDRPPAWGLLALFALLQLGRAWVIATLGRFWTTRIVTLDGAPLVRAGPYRLVRHPNYWIVAAEVAVLPLAFGNWPVAVLFSVLNAGLLGHRIRVEAAALAPRETA
ncbi:methyltransferase [Stella humosa]|uniref:Methyltransferase n=1 Tax=Stella humosa TaxID=94 RepID=A0A3N1LMZ8_9PROT|nr:isoprenylcysteine carboxylmethyltransferase family protein [Stella humosa]ROP90585.1 methyltransferase [Stella humosa]BBK29520.1 membrane protein [Stella humosa]